jgi:hypothetical protein
MDWLTQLLANLQAGGAQAAPAMGAGGMAGDLGMGAIPGGGGITPGGFDNTGVGAPGGPPGLPPSTTPAPVVAPAPQPQPPAPVESLGASLEPGAPAGSPMDIRSVAQKRMGGSQAMAPQADKIVQALRGIQPPKPPDVVKPSTPAGPHAVKQIHGGDLMALIQSLSNPRQPMQRPPTLGGALGIGRY